MLRLLAAATALLCLAPVALLADDEPRRRAELHFRDALGAWVAGDARAPGRYAHVQERVIQSRYNNQITLENWIWEIPENDVGERRPRGLTCLRDVEEHTMELLLRQSRETLPALVAFHVEVMRHLAAAPPRPWLYLATPRALDRPLEELEDWLDDPTARADARVVVAGHAFTNGTYALSQMALEDLEKALDHDRDHVAALYWKAFIHEKLAETRKVNSLLEDLLEVRPDAPDPRLRYARNKLRRGDAEEGEALLRDLVDDLRERPEHADLLALAFQEWARSAEGRGDAAAALDIARRGVRLAPRNERLQIQLAYYERRHDPRLTRDFARRLTDDLRGRAALRLSPRAAYEKPAPELASPPFARSAERVRASQGVLKAALAELSENDLASTSWVKCRGW